MREIVVVVCIVILYISLYWKNNNVALYIKKNYIGQKWFVCSVFRVVLPHENIKDKGNKLRGFQLCTFVHLHKSKMETCMGQGHMMINVTVLCARACAVYKRRVY